MNIAKRCVMILNVIMMAAAPVFALVLPSEGFGKDYNIISYGAIGDGHKG